MQPNLKTRNKKVTLNWSQLKPLINGGSAVDSHHLSIRTMDEARLFCREYGFDLDVPGDLERVARVHEEAVSFIDRYFLAPHQRDAVPASVRRPESVLDLLLYASLNIKKQRPEQLWSCAVLKVMHAIFHIDFDIKLRYFDQVRAQIFRIFDRLIAEEDTGPFLRWEEFALPLHACIRKRNKDRDSIILKLLQKPANVASDIYDHLGMRFVCETKFECLMALKILHRAHVVTPTNIKPFRSRNNLIDLGEAKKLFARYRGALDRPDGYPEEILRLLDADMSAPGKKDKLWDNPHSAREYRAIQVTVRKMIRLRDPRYDQWREMQRLLEQNLAEDTPPLLLRQFERMKPEEELRFYFDYEIQIQDRASFESSQHGPASHAAYKARQRGIARERVLGKALVKRLERGE